MRIKNVYVLVSILILTVSSINCQSAGEIPKSQQSPDSTIAPSFDAPAPDKSQFDRVDSILDFLFNEEVIKEQHGIIRIYDDTGGIWHEIHYYEDKHTDASVVGGKFRPFRFRPSDFFLTFRCTRVSKDWYEVIVNEEAIPKSLKYIRTDDQLFRYLTLEQYVLGFKSVFFNADENPIRKTPNGKKYSVHFTAAVQYTPVEIQGEWLRIEFGSRRHGADGNASDKGKHETFGWIRWKQNDKILVSEFYP